MTKKGYPELIRAAGGLVWRDSPQGRQILIIHRPRYDDWTLPKGKLKKGERWQEGALREVSEETGLRTTLGQLAGDVFYYVSGQPKIVLFWNMTVLGPDPQAQQPPSGQDEVGQMEWVLIPQGLDRLSYEGERALVRQVLDNLLREDER